jgi:hypothetical protein
VLAFAHFHFFLVAPVAMAAMYFVGKEALD